MIPRDRRTRGAANGLWILCLGSGILLVTSGERLALTGLGLALTATAFFWRLRSLSRLRSLWKWALPVAVFVGAYGFLLHLAPGADASSTPPEVQIARLFARSFGMVLAMLAVEEALRPLALRARAGTGGGGRLVFMLGLAYQLLPVFSQSLEGVALAQRAGTRLWWLRPSNLARAASSLFLLSHRLSEELALALSLRLRPRERDPGQDGTRRH